MFWLSLHLKNELIENFEKTILNISKNANNYQQLSCHFIDSSKLLSLLLNLRSVK
jgi:hypothetical protein